MEGTSHIFRYALYLELKQLISGKYRTSIKKVLTIRLMV